MDERKRCEGEEGPPKQVRLSKPMLLHVFGAGWPRSPPRIAISPWLNLELYLTLYTSHPIDFYPLEYFALAEEYVLLLTSIPYRVYIVLRRARINF